MGQPSTRTTPAPTAEEPLRTILYWLFTLPENQLRKGSNACPNHPDLRSHGQIHQTQHHCSSNQPFPHTNSSSISIWRDIASCCHLQLIVVDLIHWISMASEYILWGCFIWTASKKYTFVVVWRHQDILFQTWTTSLLRLDTTTPTHCSLRILRRSD